jgi:hypothetical protein
MVNRVLRGLRVQRMMIRCLLGEVDGETMNSSMRRDVIAKPRPLEHY